MKKGGAALIAAMICAAIGGVSSASAATSPPTTKNPSKLSGSFTMAMNLALKPGFDALHAKFQKLYPNVKMTPTYISFGGSSPYTAVLPTMISAGNPPDAMWANAGQGYPTAVKILARAGVIISQQDQPWVNSMYAPLKQNYVVNGKVYGNEMGISSLSLITYNKAIFSQQKLTVPKTWSDLLKMCRTLSAKGITPITWGGATPAVNANNTIALFYDNVISKDAKWYDKRLANKVTFAGTPGVRTSLQQLVDAQKNGCFAKGFEARSFADMATEFGAGKSAMMWTTPILMAGILQTNPGFKFGMFPPPAVKAADTRLVIQGQGSLSISSKSSGSTREAAQAWANYVYGEKQSRLLARVNFLISTNDAKSGKLPPAYADLAPYFKQNKALSSFHVNYPNTSFSDAFGNAVQGLFTGQRTIPQALAEMDRAFAVK